MEFKLGDCWQTRLPASTSQMGNACCSNLIMKAKPCLCQGGKGEEKSQLSKKLWFIICYLLS